MTPPEAIGLHDYAQYYDKTALGLNMLRDEVLGHDRFDYAFREYIKHWAFKHPLPYDFFRAMNDDAGRYRAPAGGLKIIRGCHHVFLFGMVF